MALRSSQQKEVSLPSLLELRQVPLRPSHWLIRSRRLSGYAARIGPAIAGQHGDFHTFRVCCRIVRGFALSDDEALAVLSEWNLPCEPPWTERELRDKIVRARRYGKEEIGGLRGAR